MNSDKKIWFGMGLIFTIITGIGVSVFILGFIPIDHCEIVILVSYIVFIFSSGGLYD